MSKVESKPNEISYRQTTYSTPFANLLPALADHEIRDLREDIKRRGVIIPIVVSDEHEVIDGMNRLRIAIELGLKDVPIKIVRGLTMNEKRDLAADLNVHRRHLSNAAKKKLIQERLRADPTQSNKAIATSLGVDDKTVGAHRKELETSSEIPKSRKRRGRDGRVRAAKPKRAGIDEPVEVIPTANNAPSKEQPRLFEPDEQVISDKPKPQMGTKKPYPWRPTLSDVLCRLGSLSTELRRLSKLKVVDRSPQLVHDVAGELRQIAEELDRFTANAPAA